MGAIGANGRAMEMAEAIGLGQRRVNKRRKGRPSCVDCFFHCQMLCALDLDEPCSTFRPNTADGLMRAAPAGAAHPSGSGRESRDGERVRNQPEWPPGAAATDFEPTVQAA